MFLRSISCGSIASPASRIRPPARGAGGCDSRGGVLGHEGLLTGFCGVMVNPNVCTDLEAAWREALGFHRALALLAVMPAGFIAWQRKELPERLTVASF